MKPQVFTIVPGSNGPYWMVAGIAVFLLLMVGLFAWFAYSSRNVRFEVSNEGLRIGGGMYGRTIPASSLVVDGAKVLDLRRDCNYQLRWRTNGAGLPGYQAGWFKLRNGEKSLCFVTDTSRIVYVPTTEGYSVLLSVARPEEFRSTLVSLAR
jgi:hypothetical protein